MRGRHKNVKADVIRLLAERPMTATEAAKAVGVCPQLIRTVASETGLPLQPVPKSPYARRTQTTVAFDEAELEAVRSRAKAEGLRLGEYIRRRVLEAA